MKVKILWSYRDVPFEIEIDCDTCVEDLDRLLGKTIGNVQKFIDDFLRSKDSD